MSGQFPAPAALPPGKDPQHPLDRNLGEHQNRSGSVGEEKEYLALPRIEPRSSSP
jgi:hypothetical protein